MNEQICDFGVLRELRKQEKMSIAQLAEKSGVSASVISKLERNQTTAEIETLYRIAKAFGLTLADLIGFVENRTSHRTEAEHYVSGDFHFERIAYQNVRCMYAAVKKGQRVSRPEIHRDDYEICWVRSGSIRVLLPSENVVLTEGMSIQFDALLPHAYEAESDGELLIVHDRKEKRF